MQKPNLNLYKVNQIELSQKWFRELFRPDYVIKEDTTVSELNRLFDVYENEYEDYKKNIESYDAEARVIIESAYREIKNSYNYLASEIPKRVEYKPTSKYTQDVLKAYNELVQEMARYYFRRAGTVSKGENKNKMTFGYNQNTASRRIIIYISLLYPVLMQILENIDNHFDKIRLTQESNSNDYNIINTLERFKSSFIDFKEYLEIDSENYKDYNNRRLYNSEDYIYGVKESKQAKVSWRKTRNNACYEIRCFYIELNKINGSLPNSHRVTPKYETDKKYKDGTNRIDCSPYYYCFIGEREIKREIEWQKKKRLNKYGS